MLNQNIVLPGTGVPITTYLTDNQAVESGRRRPLVLLCPGGGYRNRVPRENEPVALRLLSLGIQVVTVHYSVAPAVFPQALNELAEAVVYARAHADEWFCDSNKVAVMGFSAGGHEAASLGVLWQTLDYGEACRPNAMILGYPVITSGEFAHENSFRRLFADRYDACKELVSLEKRVSENTPPTFLWHTWEDAVVPVENSLMFASALRKHGIACEMHIYQKGMHGLSLCNDETHDGKPERIFPSHYGWIDMAARWLKEL